MKEENFAQGMLILKESFQAAFREINETTLDMWFKILEPLTDAEFENAVIFHCREYPDVPPQAGTLYKTAKLLNRIHLSAEDVLSKVVQLARGGKSIPEVREAFAGDQTALKAIDSIGWDRIRFEPSETWPFLERRFLDAYRRLRESGELGSGALFLPHDRLKMIQDRIPEVEKIGDIPEDDNLQSQTEI